jgi:hypothetical protein
VNQLVVSARNSSNRAPATIVPDPKEGKLHAYTDEVLQELHFDPRTLDDGKKYTPMGVNGLDCQVLAGEVDERAGRAGGALRLRGGSIDCGNYSTYDVDQGFSAEVWIKPEGNPKCDLVARGPLSVTLMGRAGGASIVVKYARKHPNGIEESTSETVNVPPVRPLEWYGVRVVLDRRELVVSTNDGGGFVVRKKTVFDKDEDAAKTLVVDRQANLVVASGFTGWVDDVRIGGIRSADPLEAPQGVEILPGRAIRFVDGRLDPAIHTGEEKIAIRASGTIYEYVLGTNGALVRIDEKAPPEPPAEDPAKAPGDRRPQ